jgi:tungstate transport system ATP-binding protein
VTPLFQVAGANVHFGRPASAVRALTGVSLSIHPGERVALIGANGCGKSTLLRLLHGLAAPTAGLVTRAPGLQQAMLFQRPHLMRMSVQSNIALGLWLRGTPWGEAKVLALASLARVGLSALAGRNARKLSGGQQQRVALARAWALSPQVLLLDEPTASLDPHAKREVEALIEEFSNPTQGGDATSVAISGFPGSAMTLIFASHNLGQVKRLANRVIYLEHGRVLADLPVNDFFNGPLLQSQYPAAHLFLKGELV